MSEKPLFIVIEGADGVGTTTQCELLVDWFKENGIRARHTKEPSDGPYGQLLRRRFLSDLPLPPAPELTLAFALDRLEHARTVIVPALERGEVVVADRFTLSSVVYQHDAEPNWVMDVNRYAPTPNLLIVLLASFEVSQQRMGDRQRDAFEKDTEFQIQVHRRYDAYGNAVATPAMGKCVAAVNARASKEKTQAAVRYLVEMRLDGVSDQEMMNAAAAYAHSEG